MNNANLSAEIMFEADFACGSEVELLCVRIVVGVFAVVEGMI
jgi:hypothetical protein